MDIFSVQNYCSRTKLWLVMFGEFKGDGLWKIPASVAGFGLRKVLNWEMSEEEWHIDSHINAFIQIDWNKSDFENVDTGVIDLELERINIFLPIENLDKIGILSVMRTKRILNVFKSRWLTEKAWNKFIHTKMSKSLVGLID